MRASTGRPSGPDRGPTDRPAAPRPLLRHAANRVRLQDLGVDLIVLVADYQVITDRDSPASPAARRRGAGRRLPRRRHRSRASDDLRPLARSRRSTSCCCRSSAWSASPSSSATRRSRTRSRRGRRRSNGLMFTYPVHQAADILFCKGNVGAGGQGPAPAPRADPLIARRFNERYSPDRAALPGARRAAQRRAARARHRRPEDEQEPRQRDRARRDRRRDRAADRRREDRRRPSHHLRPAAPARGREPASCSPRSARTARPRTSPPRSATRGGRRSSALPRRVNERFRAIRARRAELIGDRGHLRQVAPRRKPARP